ncbi:signal protein [Phytomonospora endophytica]|uniref:Uncharacterized protein n=1 Tax=Phytomonospora endophytica TaxID=714109 RepID=A0A841FEH5_9ACTN|nr:signal protein [Phytomonospora endophytica]MBB6033413.1 hypothetical protein [Phytomonospora endophytica]GIG70816.1 hypothetical protein Pen01_71110 [Phytomonospora endophytica]
MPWVRRAITAAPLAAALLAATACGGARDIAADKLPVLQNEWWDWVVSSPVDRNPVTDTTGAFCGEGQPDDIWFLAGTFGDAAGPVDRACEMPAGVPILVPAVNLLALPDLSGAPESQACLEVMGQMSGVITLDGAEVLLEKVEGAQVTVKGVMGNPISHDLSMVSGAGCGLWARIAPLAPGAHTLTIRGEMPGANVDVDYALTVTD